MTSSRIKSKLNIFLANELGRKEGRRCMIIKLFYVHGADYRDEEIRSWTRDEYLEIFEDPAKSAPQLAAAIIDIAKGHSDAIRASRHYVVHSIRYLGDRQTHDFKLPGATSP